MSNVRVYGASEYEVLDHQDSEPHETETSDFEELMGRFPGTAERGGVALGRLGWRDEAGKCGGWTVWAYRCSMV